MASLQLGTELRSSPTISSDGIIYVTGIMNGKPTLFAIEGAATGYAANAWSQMGGNPCKTGYMYQQFKFCNQIVFPRSQLILTPMEECLIL